MKVIKDEACAKDDCPSFGVPEAGEGDMVTIRGADPEDPTKERDVLMRRSVLDSIVRQYRLLP